MTAWAALDTAVFDWHEVEPTTRIRRGRVLLYPDGALPIDWLGYEAPMDEVLHRYEALLAWERPTGDELAALAQKLTEPQRRTIRVLPGVAIDQHNGWHHFHVQDRTADALVKHGLSTGNRLTDLGFLLHVYLNHDQG